MNSGRDLAVVGRNSGFLVVTSVEGAGVVAFVVNCRNNGLLVVRASVLADSDVFLGRPVNIGLLVASSVLTASLLVLEDWNGRRVVGTIRLAVGVGFVIGSSFGVPQVGC